MAWSKIVHGYEQLCIAMKLQVLPIMADFQLEAVLPGTRPPPGWGEGGRPGCLACLCGREEEHEEAAGQLGGRAGTQSTLLEDSRRRGPGDLESAASSGRPSPGPPAGGGSSSSGSGPRDPFLSPPSSRGSSSLASSPPSTLLLYNPDCPVHAGVEDMFEDTEGGSEKKPFLHRLHPFQAYFVGAIDRAVELTSHTQFAQLLQTSELYWDTTAGINRMDANCRVLFPLAFALLNAVYWPTYMFLL
jgi:hypothetical protein